MQEFILHETNKAHFWSLLKELLLTKKRWRIKISEYRERRTLSQNSLLWMWNQDITTAINKQSQETLTDEDIHEFLKGLFCPAKPVTVLGVTRMVKSTKLLNTEEMSFYLRRIEVWCVERGMKLRIPINSEYHEKGTQDD